MLQNQVMRLNDAIFRLSVKSRGVIWDSCLLEYGKDLYRTRMCDFTKEDYDFLQKVYNEERNK